VAARDARHGAGILHEGTQVHSIQAGCPIRFIDTVLKARV